jgi:hypothetical protein
MLLGQPPEPILENIFDRFCRHTVLTLEKSTSIAIVMYKSLGHADMSTQMKDQAISNVFTFLTTLLGNGVLSIIQCLIEKSSFLKFGGTLVGYPRKTRVPRNPD